MKIFIIYQLKNITSNFLIKKLIQNYNDKKNPINIHT